MATNQNKSHHDVVTSEVVPAHVSNIISKNDVLPYDAIWASLMIEELVRNGVTDFCIAPGSRSTALTLAIASNQQTSTRVHFDERGLGFFALGLAKSTCKPVVIVTTSGTAVANLFPAIIEAYHSRVPLIILSADRPLELLDTSANQTIKQDGVFADYVAWKTTMEAPTSDIPAQWVLSTIDSAVHQSRVHSRPVHLNCRYREPFNLSKNMSDYTGSPYLDALSSWFNSEQPFTHYHRPVATLEQEVLERLSNKLSHYKNGVIVCGQLQNEQEAEAILSYADYLVWPILPDITSGLRLKDHPLILGDVEKNLTQTKVAPDCFLHLGGRLVSKRLTQFISESKKPYFLVSPFPDRQDPDLCVTDHFQTSIEQFCEHIMKLTPKNVPSQWSLAQSENLSISKEEKIISSLCKSLSEDHVVMLGNSLPIRLMNTFASQDKPYIPIIHANRGASGIDGLIATAAGLVSGSKKKGVLLIGDLSTLHDLNSLALLQDLSQPLSILVLNNNGGGIFSTLPIAQESDYFETFFKTPHQLEFKHAAGLFNLDYEAINDDEEVEKSIQIRLAHEQSGFLEIFQ